jgi:hypothetical protein
MSGWPGPALTPEVIVALGRAVLGREMPLSLASELLPYLQGYQRTASDLQQLGMATGDVTNPEGQEFIEDARLGP